MIGIIDYGMGNLRSVQKAFEHVGASASILSRPQEAERVGRLVLPGVGAFADGMANLTDRGWVEPIRDWIGGDQPFLGICLGMQLLFDGSEEDASQPGESISGLGVLPGQVVEFERAGEAMAHQSGDRLKVPHMGWNSLRWSRQDPLLAGLAQDDAVYFVHAYYAQPGDPACLSATTTYGRDFCATVWRDRLWATQFHPEKSQRVGLKMLANFAAA